MKECIRPRSLQPGDRIAILAPAGIVKAANVHQAAAILKQQGWDPYVCPNTFRRHGIYAGTDDQRFADLRQALLDPDTRAIMCARGGYGVVHLLERLNQLPLRDDPKWVIGFSDISALHALLLAHGIASVHGHMTGHLANSRGLDDDSNSEYRILCGEPNTYQFAASRHNRQGTVTAPLVGGNLSVISDLIGTPFDMVLPGTILFIEDVSEPAYKIERMLWQLRLSGVMEQLAGLIVGQFAKCDLDVGFPDIAAMIADIAAPYTFPMACCAPIGHVSHNIPLIEGLDATLEVGPKTVTITQ